MTRACRVLACAILTSATVVAMTPHPAAGQDDSLANVLVSGFYGGLVGALVGGAVMVLTDEPGDHLNYITTGAGIGVIAGTAYGLTQVARYAMIDVDRGRVVWQIPSIEPAVKRGPGTESAVTLSASLVRISF